MPKTDSLKGRTRAGRLVTELRTQLQAHVGGAPDAVQHQLIEQAVRLKLRLHLLDEALDEARETARSHAYPALARAFADVLQRLGPSRADPTLLAITQPLLPALRAGLGDPQ